MNRPPASVRRRATLLVSAAIVVGLYVMTREPALSKSESEAAVNNFRFSRTPLPEVANHPPYKYVRKVHPSVRHIRAYLSTLGASVAMGDLDGLVDFPRRTEIVGRDDEALQQQPRLSRPANAGRPDDACTMFPGSHLFRATSGMVQNPAGWPAFAGHDRLNYAACSLRSRRNWKNSTPSRRRRFIIWLDVTISPTIDAILLGRK